jgi:two-component system, NarL family, sensor histidine kinase BarA
MATILIVDENSIERRITRMTLEVDGHRLAEAATPKDALELIRSFAFDIVMLTVNGGAAHDFDLITQTRAMGGREATQFVAILEHEDEKGPVESFMNGVSDLLIRPFGPPDLREVVQRATTPQEVDLRDRLVGIQLDAYETAVRLQEQARSER